MLLQVNLKFQDTCWYLSHTNNGWGGNVFSSSVHQGVSPDPVREGCPLVLPCLWSCLGGGGVPSSSALSLVLSGGGGGGALVLSCPCRGGGRARG